jgi:hypothetical protein
MIDRHDIMNDFRSELLRRSLLFQKPQLTPLPISPWVAAALLQKAIRRGRRRWALAAASTLILIDPIRLWRRLAAVAFEDVGMAAPDVCGLVAGALAGKRVRLPLGGEWHVAALLTDLLASAPKCRATDDVYMATELLPRLRPQRRTFAEMSDAELRHVVLREDDLHAKALALNYLVGTGALPSKYLLPRRGAGDWVFRVLDDLGVPPTIITVGREGFRRTRETLPLLLCLLMVDRDDTTTATIADDLVEPDILAGPIPSWSIDGHTREGRLALARLRQLPSPFSAFLQRHIVPDQWSAFSARALFHVESGRLIRRRRTPRSDELRRVAEEEALGAPPGLAREALALLADELPTLHGLRAEIMAGGRDV